MDLYDKMLESYISTLLEKKIIRLGGSNISVGGNPSPQDVKKIMASYRTGKQFAVKKLYPIYKRSWDGKASPQTFSANMKPSGINFQASGWDLFFNTNMFEDHSIVVRFNKNGKPVDAHI